MTMPIQDDQSAGLQAWASRQLDLPADAAWPDGRAAFLRQLVATNFCPPPPLDYAQRVLAGGADAAPTSVGWQQAQLDLEKALAAEIGRLARAWFALSVSARTRRFQELQGPCTPYPHLRLRLEALEPGLDLDAAELDGPVGQLAQMVCELFVLDPAQRGERRRALLLELEEELDFWESTAADLRQRHPRYAELEPVLIEELLSRRTYAERARRAQKEFARSVKASAHSGGRNIPVLLIVFAVLVVVRIIISSMSSSPPPPRPVPPPPIIQPIIIDIDENMRKHLDGPWNLENGKLAPALKEAPAPQLQPLLPEPPNGR